MGNKVHCYNKNNNGGPLGTTETDEKKKLNDAIIET